MSPALEYFKGGVVFFTGLATIRDMAITKKIKEKKTKKRKAAKAVKIRQDKALPKPERYFEAIGRRKTSVARIRIFTQGEKTFYINNKPLDLYFPNWELRQKALGALEKMNYLDKFKITVVVKGGGLHSQAEAVRHGIARALVLFNQEFRKQLKRAGFLTRDPRMRERKKFGLKRARRAPQWQKR